MNDYIGKINYVPQTNIFITDQFGVCDLVQLNRYNIKHVFNISPVQLREHVGITYYHLPVLDESQQNIIQFFDKVFLKIDELVAQGQYVVINCQAGVSRSASFVIGYLIKKGLSYDNSYQLLKLCRPIINPNRGFVEQLKQYENIINSAGGEVRKPQLF